MRLGKCLHSSGGGAILAKNICCAPPPVVSLESDGLRQALAVSRKCMRRLLIPYNFLIIVFCLGTTLLLLSSPHHVDTEFIIVNTASLIIFPLTAYYLKRTYSVSKKMTNWTILLIFLTGCIVIYYICDLATNEIDGIQSIILFPIIVLLITALFVIDLLKKRRKQRAQM